MDSYQLISNKVSELTQAYSSVKKKRPSSKHDSFEPMQSVSEEESLVQNNSLLYKYQTVASCSISHPLRMQDIEDPVSIDGKRCSEGRQGSSILNCKSEELAVPRDRRKSVSRSRRSDQTELTSCQDYFQSELPNSIDKPRSFHSSYANTAQDNTCDVHSITKDWCNTPTAPLEPTSKPAADTSTFETDGPLQVESEQRVVLLDRLEALEKEVLQLKDRMAANPDRTDLRAIRRLLDDYDEKANQCWKELSSLRNTSVRRNQKTRVRVQQLTDELHQLQTASFSKARHMIVDS